MQCQVCSVAKLSQEFPSHLVDGSLFLQMEEEEEEKVPADRIRLLSEDDEDEEEEDISSSVEPKKDGSDFAKQHFCCLQCLLNRLKIEEARVCPFCGSTGHYCKESDGICLRQEYELIAPPLDPKLEILTPDIASGSSSSNIFSKSSKITGDDKGELKCYMLDGYEFKVPFERKQPILKINALIQHALRDRMKAKGFDIVLYRNGNEEIPSHETCGGFGFKDGDSVFVAFVHSMNLKKVVLKLRFRKPSSMNYLDASVLIFKTDLATKKIEYADFVDFEKRFADFDGISHSGDVDVGGLVQHTIKLDLDSVPLHVTHMYFTLSAYRSPTIAPFTEVHLSMHDPSDKDNQLVEYGAEHLKSPDARTSQAVIMCSVTRNATFTNKWEIAVDARLSRGNNLSLYSEIIETILQSFSSSGSSSSARSGTSKPNLSSLLSSSLKKIINKHINE